MTQRPKYSYLLEEGLDLNEYDPTTKIDYKDYSYLGYYSEDEELEEYLRTCEQDFMTQG